MTRQISPGSWVLGAWVRSLGAWVLLLASVVPAGAHVGSPDVFVDSSAGPYRLLITVRPPRVIPGVAEVEIVASSDDITSVRVVPTPMAGPGARFAPTAEPAKRQPGHAGLFTAGLWMMTAGAWEVRVTVEGRRGTAEAVVPVPTLPQATLAMTRPLKGLLFGLMLLLSAGFVAIISALAREATLGPAELPSARSKRRGRVAAAITTAGVLGALTFGNWWWGLEAARYDGYVYKPLEVTTRLSPSHLDLTLNDPGWIALRRLDDLVPDHGHLMHLFVVSESLDQLWHLHPEQRSTSNFSQPLPPASAGRYALFADIVHASGISETATGSLDLVDHPGMPLGSDDAVWKGPSTNAGTVAELAGGGRMVWVRDAASIRPKQMTSFTFRVEDANGQPATDLELYMGMPGHAIFIRRDQQVFAHVHPSGSAPMAAMEIGRRTIAPAPPPTDLMADHGHGAAALPATVSFPYGLPSAGDYRIFVQVRRAGRIETGVFDVKVER